MAGEAFVQADDSAVDVIWRKPQFCGAETRTAGLDASTIIVREEAKYRRGERRGLLWIHESSHGRIDQFSYRANIRRHHRKASLERLHDGERKRFPARRQDEQIRSVQPRGRIVAMAYEDDSVSEAEVVCERPEFGACRPVANNDQAYVRPDLNHVPKCLNQDIYALLTVEPGHGNEERSAWQAKVTSCLYAIYRLRARGDAVTDDLDLATVYPRSTRQGVRHAFAGSDNLGRQDPGGPRIVGLAAGFASVEREDHWRTCPSSGQPPHEQGSHLVRVDHIDGMVPQVAAKQHDRPGELRETPCRRATLACDAHQRKLQEVRRAGWCPRARGARHCHLMPSSPERIGQMEYVPLHASRLETGSKLEDPERRPRADTYCRASHVTMLPSHHDHSRR